MKLYNPTISLKLLVLIVFFCFVNVNAFSFSSNKVLIISSYGSDYQWSNSIMDGVNTKLKSTYPGIELNIEYLSSELFANPDSWMLKMNAIIDSYQETLPLVIIFISDEAWMAYNSVNTDKFRDVPILLCAVKPHTIGMRDYCDNINNLQLSDFSSTLEVMKDYNASGVLREMNVSGYIDLMAKVVPKMDRLALVTDKRFYGVYTKLIFEEEIKKNHPNYPVEYIDARFVKTDSLLKNLPKITSNTGLLLTSWLTGEHGFEYSKDYIYKEMAAELKTPIFITNNIGIEKGYFLGGYFNRAAFWGEEIGTMLLEVIGGKNPRDIQPVTMKDDQCYINWKVLHKFDYSEMDFPNNVVYLNRPEQFFEKYKIQVLFGIAIFVVIIVAYVYILRSHLRLQRAQKQTLQAVAQTTIANEKLREISKNLIVALKKAEESDRLKSAFLANMSHEIRTPLNAIVGFSELITTAENDDERADLANIIKRNSDLLLQLISDILDISKIEAGILSFTYAPVDLNAICHNAVTSMQFKCEEGVILTFTKPKQVIVATTDQNRLMQVLVNLISNAIKFTNKGSIEVGYQSYDENLVEFFVKDSGVGITSDNLAHIFDRFVKLDSYKEGTGLGLSICKTIVETLGGQIGVESECDKGSRFWFRIRKNME